MIHSKHTDTSSNRAEKGSQHSLIIALMFSQTLDIFDRANFACCGRLDGVLHRRGGVRRRHGLPDCARHGGGRGGGGGGLLHYLGGLLPLHVEDLHGVEVDPLLDLLGGLHLL